MSDTQESRKNSATPQNIWDAAASISHSASYFLARHVKTNRDEDSIDAAPVGAIKLRPGIGQPSKTKVLVRLRALARLDNHAAVYEEGAEVKFSEPHEYSESDLQDFATEYVLPFLIPYVEVGLERICYTLRETPPNFPLYIIKGTMYINESATGWDEDLDDDES